MRLLIGGVASFIALLVSLPLLVLSSPFWFVGIGQRVIGRLLRRVQGKAVQWDALLAFEPAIGWKPRPNLRACALDLAGNRFSLTTDGDGWRTIIARSQGHDVFVFGDSFAFGFGASDKTFFANILAEPRIKSIGANGYSLVQELLLMERYSDQIKGRTVIWFVYHGNDLLENLTPNMRRYRMPFVRQKPDSEEWEITNAHVSEKPWTIGVRRDYYGRLAEICCETDLSRKAFSACDFLIRRGKALCDRVGARLVVVSLPDVLQIDESRVELLAKKAPDPVSFDAHRPDRQLETICSGLGVEFRTTKGILTPEHFIRGDVHWNASGNRRVAELIRDIYYHRPPTGAVA
jgi:hypothetical protein